MAAASVRQGHLNGGWEVEEKVGSGTTCGVTAVLLVSNRRIDEVGLTVIVEIRYCNGVGDVGSEVSKGRRRPCADCRGGDKTDVFHVSIVEHHGINFPVAINITDVEIVCEVNVQVDDAGCCLRRNDVEVVGCRIGVCQAREFNDRNVVAFSGIRNLICSIIEAF